MTDGRLFAGAEMPGVFESRTAARRGRSSARSTGIRHASPGTTPRTSRPATSACRRSFRYPDDAARYFAIVQGVGIFETTDDGETWTPRNKGLRADWPLEHEDVGFCVHKLVRSPQDTDRLYQQNHVGMHRSDDGALTWTEITEGLPTEFGFAAAAHPHDRDTFYVIPLDPGHGRVMPEGKAAVWRTRDAGSSWQRLDDGLPQRRRARRRAARGHGDRLVRRAGRLLRHEHGTGVRERGRR